MLLALITVAVYITQNMFFLSWMLNQIYLSLFRWSFGTILQDIIKSLRFIQASKEYKPTFVILISCLDHYRWAMRFTMQSECSYIHYGTWNTESNQPLLERERHGWGGATSSVHFSFTWLHTLQNFWMCNRVVPVTHARLKKSPSRRLRCLEQWCIYSIYFGRVVTPLRGTIILGKPVKALCCGHRCLVAISVMI